MSGTEIVIFLGTIATGFALFQALVAWEALRRLITDTHAAMQIDWGKVRVKKAPRRYMIRYAGTMTIDPAMPGGIVNLTSHTDADFDSGDADPYC